MGPSHLLGKMERSGLALVHLEHLTTMEAHEVWDKEPDFTSWLASEGLDSLGKTLGLDLTDAQVEVNVGPFSADLVCVDRSEKAHPVKVVIENQYNKADHKHLGQVLTYAAWLDRDRSDHDVKHIVWIAEVFDDQHRYALDWLNQVTSDDVWAFGVELRLYSINGNGPALEFNLVSKPDGWRGGGIGDPGDKYREFWRQVNERLTKVRRPKPQSAKFMFFGSTKSDQVKLRGSFTKQKIEVALITKDENAFKFAKMLEKDKDAIEDTIGERLTWRFRNDGSQNVISHQRVEVDPEDTGQWSNLSEWFGTYLERFHEAFWERVQLLDPKDFQPEDSDGTVDDPDD